MFRDYDAYYYLLRTRLNIFVESCIKTLNLKLSNFTLNHE